MEIRIDTHKDSSEDIRKAIDLLKQFVGDEKTDSSKSKEFSLDNNVSSMNGIFSDDNTGSVFDNKKEEKKKIFDDEVRIIPY